MHNKSNCIGFYTIFRKEMVRVFRIWQQTLLPPVITTSLYFVIFGSIIGNKIGPMQGVSYMQYIVPGLIMMVIITNSYANVVSSFFGAKFQRNIEEILISPVSPSTIIWGYLSGGICRGVIVGAIVALVSKFYITISIKTTIGTIIITLLTAILFALCGLLNGIFAKKFDDISIIPTFVLTPLTYLGGVFYSIQSLPEVWQKLTLFNPIFYMVNGFRFCIIGISDIGLWHSISVLLLLCTTFYIICEVLIRKGIGIKS